MCTFQFWFRIYTVLIFSANLDYLPSQAEQTAQVRMGIEPVTHRPYFVVLPSQIRAKREGFFPSVSMNLSLLSSNTVVFFLYRHVIEKPGEPSTVCTPECSFILPEI